LQSGGDNHLARFQGGGRTMNLWRGSKSMKNINSATTISPLDDTETNALFKLLGEAWYAQAKSQSGGGVNLLSRVDVGKREFLAIAPVLGDALRQPCYNTFLRSIATTLRRDATWPMPTPLVAALALRVSLTKNVRRAPRPVSLTPSELMKPLDELRP
jgi:hypothetical protein